MNLPVSFFSAPWQWVMAVLSVLILYQAIRRAPWHRLGNTVQLNVFLGMSVALTLLWSLKAGVKPGLNLHMLGSMAVTLALGPRLAVVSVALALSGITLNGAIEWAAWPVNFILMGAVPIATAYAIQRLVEHFLPAHFFIFIFVICFAGAAVTVMIQGVVASLVMMLAGAYTGGFLLENYLPFFILIGFSEAWMSGAMLTLMVVYRPEWVVAFDDQHYLLNK